MKYTYLTGRSVMPDGNKSTKLTCHECGEPQSHSYLTKCGKHICFTCKLKDENGNLENQKVLICEFGRDNCIHNKDGYCKHQETIDSGEDCISFICWHNLY